MLFGKLFTNPKMWFDGDADEIKMGGVYTCKDVQNVPTGDGALLVFKTENTVKQVFIPVGVEGVLYTRTLGGEWTAVSVSEISDSIEEVADDLDEYIASNDAALDVVRGIAQSAAGSTPSVVTTVAEMTDEDAIYVYAGSEENYTAGNWYYYNGTAWTSGGVYGARIEDVAPASSRYTGNNLLPNPLHETKTMAGVTYTWDASTSTWNVVGTSTGTSFTNLYDGLTTLSLPSGIEAGKTYYVEYEPSDNNIEIDYQWYDENSTKTGDSRTPKSMYISVPENTVGCIIRIRVWSGRTANGTTANPRIFLAVDNTNDIVSMLNTKGICTLGKGNYYVDNLTMPNNSTLSGIGDETVIHTIHRYRPISYAILPTSGCLVKDVKIIGTDSVPNNLNAFSDSWGYVGGVNISGTILSAVRLSNLTVSNCDRIGINLDETGGTTRGGVIINNAKIDNCWCGIWLSANSEYNKISNCIIRACSRGCVNDGGNNTFTGCTFHGIVGFMIEGASSNSGHGTCVGCTFNHIDNIANPDTLGGGRAVFIASLTNGFVFDACQFWYGAIYLSNSRGVMVSNSQMGDGVQNPHITVTGSYPAFFNNIIFHQTPVISDAASSKFTACYLDSDGSAVTGTDA